MGVKGVAVWVGRGPGMIPGPRCNATDLAGYRAKSQGLARELVWLSRSIRLVAAPTLWAHSRRQPHGTTHTEEEEEEEEEDGLLAHMSVAGESCWLTRRRPKGHGAGPY